MERRQTILYYTQAYPVSQGHQEEPPLTYTARPTWLRNGSSWNEALALISTPQKRRTGE
jgi:hypothetical protein